MKKILFVYYIISFLVLASCESDSDFLNTSPNQVIPTAIAFSDPAIVLSILGELYNRQVDFSSLDGNETTAGWRTFSDFSQSFPSQTSSYDIVQRNGWRLDEWATWDYSYIRDLNQFIQRIGISTALTEAEKLRFSAEARFLRANYYFELVKRMGGVPLVTTPLQYNAANPSLSQVPRSKEYEIYDFVISEAEAIQPDLPGDAAIKSRATKGGALAMETRAALYAASIAKYGATTPLVSLPDGEVGIPAAKATAYYSTALAAATKIINGSAGAYKLYNVLPDKSDNFAALFLDKTVGNTESIFIEDFLTASGKIHDFTVSNQPYSIAEGTGNGGRLNPSLNLAQSFEKLDNSYAPFTTRDGAGNPIYYDNPLQLFAGRDARLAGTILLPNTTFKQKALDIWGGYFLIDGSILTSSEARQLKPLPGTTTNVQVVGADGPVDGLEFRTQTGFYIRKWLDPASGSGNSASGSAVAFIRYRYAEVLLNAAEACFELGQTGTATTYLNLVRSRAGLTIPLTNGDINFDRIVHERRVELAFEGHILFDMKRWRLAQKVWDGTPLSLANLVSNIGSASKRDTQPWGLWPYRTYFPGNPLNGKWIFREVLPAAVTGSSFFQLGNYYSSIGSSITSANPKIVQQPNQ